MIPKISANIHAEQNYKKFIKLLVDKKEYPLVLILGGSIHGEGMKKTIAYNELGLVETDVSFGARTMLICDAHDIPFKNKTFDGVIVQAVLEHVADPYRCVNEIFRVLNTNGIVYAETPFMQQVHMGPFDFTRFTQLGHRRLFRNFSEIDSGIICGPGMALAWSYRYFLLSFTEIRIIRSLISLFAAFTAFYLKYFDYYLMKKKSAYDAASGFYFMGRKTNRVITDRELVKLYKGKVKL